MLYIGIALVSLAVGLLGNRYFAGSGYGLVGDLALRSPAGSAPRPCFA